MHGLGQRLGVVLLLALAFAGAVLVSTALAEMSAIQRVGAMFKGSDVVLVTNRTNLPIVRAERMLPGQTARGSIKVGNFGDDPGTLWVKPRRQVDTVGIFGGELSQRLMLRIVSLSRPKGTAWRGYVREMGRVKLGVLRPGQVRRFRFIVQFRVRPPARSGLHENLFMKSTYKTDWVFQLTPKR
jgi:hypothetical protein